MLLIDSLSMFDYLNFGSPEDIYVFAGHSREGSLRYLGGCIRSLSKFKNNNIIIIIILSFDIAPFPYKHAQRRITFIVRG